MSVAFNLVPPRFADNRDKAIEAGLRVCGYEVVSARQARPTASDDVLVTWNLHLSGSEPSAEAFKAVGAKVIVCEEGYTRRLGPEKHFAMALDGHNGSGQWSPRGPERWDRLGLKLQPYREDGRHILVCSQRGMGSALMRQPRDWPQDVIRKLKHLTDRPIVHRPHPGKRFKDVESLASQLKDCWAVVVWASNCGIAALLAGVPVFYEAPYSVVASVCDKRIARIETPSYPDRLPALQSMAWAQWTPAEITRGEAFRHLLRAEV
jgi:hypothetical protein